LRALYPDKRNYPYQIHRKGKYTMIDLGQYDAARDKPARTEEESNRISAESRARVRAVMADEQFWADIEYARELAKAKAQR
jgi:hypothetical protein